MHSLKISVLESKEVKESMVLRDLLHYVVINLIRRLSPGLLRFLSCFDRCVNAVQPSTSHVTNDISHQERPCLHQWLQLRTHTIPMGYQLSVLQTKRRFGSPIDWLGPNHIRN